MKKAEPANTIGTSSVTIKNVMMQGMFFTSDGEISIGYVGEEGDACHDCACKHFLPRHIERFVSYKAADALYVDILASKISYGVVPLGRGDKGINFAVIDAIMESHCFMKGTINFSLDKLQLYSRRSEEKEIHTVYIPLSMADAEWKPVDEHINLCYMPTLFGAISSSSKRDNTAVLTHPFAAETYRLHELPPIAANHSSSFLRHVVLGRTKPAVCNDDYLFFRKEVRNGESIFDCLGGLEQKGLAISRVETQCAGSFTRLYIMGKFTAEIDVDEDILLFLGIQDHEFIGIL